MPGYHYNKAYGHRFLEMYGPSLLTLTLMTCLQEIP